MFDNTSNDLPYCLMPWIHLHIGDHGKAKACCVANIPFGDINEDSLDDIWNGESINKLREKFTAGIPDKRCAQCIHVEAAGGKSMRLETHEKYQHSDWKKQQQPFYFDIRFSNVCNFRCRTCWHGASSKWFQDAKILGRNIGEKAIIKNIKDFDLFIKKCGSGLKNAKEIYIAGGEPLVTEEHYLLLEWLIANGNTELLLRYNTNFSKLSFKQWDVLKLWTQFSNIELMASIDGTGPLGEYVRKEMDWNVVIENRAKIKTLSHIDFKISPTVSVLNMKHLPKMYMELVQNKFIQPEEIYLNILERPNFYNIQIFPKEQKLAIAKAFESLFIWMRKENISERVIAKFQVCIDYMNREDWSHLWGKYLGELAKLDQLRNENCKVIGIVL